MIPGFQIIENNLVDSIKQKLNYAGIYFRIFSRIKHQSSIKEKIKRKNTYHEGKKMQDLFGVRIVTYFYDDVKILYDYLKDDEFYENEAIDKPELTEFKARRTNLVFRLSPYLTNIFNETVNSLNLSYLGVIDNTYELQLRTIFSEGWHEIDHSLRYKYKESWYGLNEEERLFNGIFAGLETSDNSLIKLFDDIAFHHYKRNDIESLLRTKFRLNYGLENINRDIKGYLSNQKTIVKDIFKLEREEVIGLLLNYNGLFPLNMNTFLYYLNFNWLKNKKLFDLTPEILFEEFKKVSRK